MPPAFAYLSRTWSSAVLGERRILTAGVLGLLHFAALITLLWTEDDLEGRVAFLIAWGFLNFFLLIAVRRPTIAGALSLILVVILIFLSRFKQEVLIMTANFIDVMLIDHSTVSFLLTVFPNLRWTVGISAAVIAPLLVL